MSLYQKKFSFRGLVFSPSPQMERLCNLLNIKVVKNISRNEYGVPFVRGMLETMKKLVHADYYGYMNSDILLHPNVLNILPIIDTKYQLGILPPNFQLISRVLEIANLFYEYDFSTLRKVDILFTKYRYGLLRNPYSLV